MSESKFQADLRAFYEAQRRGHLESKLESATELMRETLLLGAVYEGLFNEAVRPGEEVRSMVESLREHVRASEFNAIEDEIDTTLAKLEAERDGVREELQHRIREIEDRISGFESLNRRIEKLNAEQIQDLRKQAASLDQVPAAREENLDELLMMVRESTESFDDELEAVEAALFEDFQGSDIEAMVRSLLRGERLRLGDREESELKALQQSELGPYVNLSLEGE